MEELAAAVASSDADVRRDSRTGYVLRAAGADPQHGRPGGY